MIPEEAKAQGYRFLYTAYFVEGSRVRNIGWYSYIEYKMHPLHEVEEASVRARAIGKYKYIKSRNLLCVTRCDAS